MSLCYQPNCSQVSVIVLKANALPEGPSGSRPGEPFIDLLAAITIIRECCALGPNYLGQKEQERCQVVSIFLIQMSLLL